MMATTSKYTTSAEMKIADAGAANPSPEFRREYLKRNSTSSKGMPCEEPLEFVKYCMSKNNGQMEPCLVEWKNFKACHYDTERNIDRITL
mmetsp:Transcript_2514/g.3365  ORF Transcript_2514/g.3365 Transcript_2514/m.3365 type:complete len:90 (-) Transcript_2514:517-786(-)